MIKKKCRSFRRDESFPCTMAAINGPEGKHGIGSCRSPVHSGALHTLLDHVPDAAFNGSAPNVIAELFEGVVHHSVAAPVQIADETIDFFAFGP
jgi:hypothetical protein